MATPGWLWFGNSIRGKVSRTGRISYQWHHQPNTHGTNSSIFFKPLGQGKAVAVLNMSGLVALDTFDPEGTKYMREIFPDIIEQGHPLHETWPDHAVGLFVAKSRVTADMLGRAKKLKFIVRHGAGYDNIDADACQKNGIILCNLPGISVSPPCVIATSKRLIGFRR